MTNVFHAPSRRELLLASGVLFAWAHLPRAALAEGRDPRFLTIVLRGALDGLAAVAPVGDPDWVRLRGDNALTLGRHDAGFAARRLLRAQSGDAEPRAHVPRRPRDDRPCRRLALSRALAFRRPGRAGKRLHQARRRGHRLAQPRAGDHGAGRACARRQGGLRGRPGDAAGRARPRSGVVVDAAETAAGDATTP